MTDERPQDREFEDATEAGSEQSQADEQDPQGPSPEQQDPESGPAADQRQSGI